MSSTPGASASEDDEDYVRLGPEDGITTSARKILFEHTLSSVLNDPTVRDCVVAKFYENTSRSNWKPPEIPANPSLPQVSMQSFSKYLDNIREPNKALVAIRADFRLSQKLEAEALEDNPKVKEIPQLYFRENFTMADAATFQSIIDTYSYQLLLEKLSHFLDIIEMEITTKISKRSNGFFNALHNLQKLHSEVLAACQEIDTLRDAMAYMDEKTVKDALSIVQKNVRRQHLSTVMETIQQIKMVKTTLSTIDVLVESGDYFGAIEMIRAAQVNLDEELGGIHALNHYREKMKDYVAVIEDKLSLQFVEYAEGEGDLSEFDKMHLTPIIKELVTINKFQKTLQMYREHQQDLMKECVSQIIAGVSSDAFDESSMKQYEVKEFLEKLGKVFKRSLRQLQRVKVVITYIESITKEVDANQKQALEEITAEAEASQAQAASEQANGVITGTLSLTMMATLKAKQADLERIYEDDQRQRALLVADGLDILFSVAELIHTRTARLLKARTEQHRRLPLEHFALFSNAMADFMKESEAIANRQCYGLRPTVLSQTKAFLENFHSNKVSKLKNLLEVETWTQAEVASEFFFIFKCLMDTEEGLYKQHSNELPAGKNLKALEIVGEKYLVVNTLLFFGEILHDYLVCVDTLPVLAVDVIFRLAEILTLFNRRTCELVLGKEAVSFGLIKTITASHLAMASQCLSLLITLVPNLSERLRGYLKDEKQHAFLGEIETVLMDYIEHRQQIFQKFVRMMSDRVDDCTKVYKPDESSTKPSAAFETLAKKTQMLHKILRPILPPSQFKTIFRQVFSEYMDKLKAFFARLSPRNVKEKQRISNDVVFLLLKLRELEGVDDPGEELLAYVQTLYK